MKLYSVDLVYLIKRPNLFKKNILTLNGSSTLPILLLNGELELNVLSKQRATLSITPTSNTTPSSSSLSPENTSQSKFILPSLTKWMACVQLLSSLWCCTTLTAAFRAGTRRLQTKQLRCCCCERTLICTWFLIILGYAMEYTP